MPKPGKNEKRSDYIGRGVSMLKKEAPARPTKECLGQCYGMWTEHTKQKGKA